MPTDTLAHTRRCERKPQTLPIGLVLKGENLKADGSAITVDISQRGASVRTKLELVPGEWVGVVPKGDYPYPIPARTVWVHEDELSKWTFAGLEFLDNLEV